MFNYGGTSFTSANLEDHFDSSNIFTEESGFQIAVALHYDFDGKGVDEDFDILDYMTVKAIVEEAGTTTEGMVELEATKCTEE